MSVITAGHLSVLQNLAGRSGRARPGGVKSGPADRVIQSAAITHHNTGELHRGIGVEQCLRDQVEFGNSGAIATSSHTEATGVAQFG